MSKTENKAEVLNEEYRKRVKFATDGRKAEEQTDGDLISRTDLLKDIADLKKSPWFNSGKNIKDLFQHNSYVARKEAVEIIEDLCIKKLPSAEKTTLSTEKTTITDGDLISRKAVIDLLNRLIEVERKQGTDVMNYGRERVNAYESILDEIESDYLFPSIPSAEQTDSSIPQEDVADILNIVESALKDTNYEVVGYDNTDGFLKVLIDVK